MSFLDSLVSIGKGVGSFLGGSGIASQLAKTALLGIALNQVNKSVNKSNDVPREPTITETREKYIPSTDNSVPVVYGTAFTKGIITDAYLEDKKYMWYCITICEKTGKTALGTGEDSVFTFEEMFLNRGRVYFQEDGITVSRTVDIEGNENTKINGLVKIWCYNNGSNSPTTPLGSSASGIPAAMSIMPHWNSAFTMNQLVFAIVRVEYNKLNEVTSLGEIEFKIKNTMTEPGDCIFDYMTNTRYGAGIPKEEIDLS